MEGTYNASTERWRVRDLTALQHAELTEDLLGFFGVPADHVQASNSLAIQTCILCVTLADEQRQTLIHEVSDRPSIAIKISGLLSARVSFHSKAKIMLTHREALVCAVEERKQVALLEDVGDFLPLLASRVDAGGVVRASMKQDHRFFGYLLHCFCEAFKVQSNCLRVIVRIVLSRAAQVGKDRLVIGCDGSISL